MKKIFFLMFYVTIVLCENQNDLNDSLHEFSKKRNEPNFYRNQAVDRTKKSNMRKSTEFAQKVHDTFTFVQDFLKNSGRLSKRQVPPNPGSPGYVIAAGNCPYTTIKVTCNSQSKYRTYDGTCNNLKNPLDGSANTPYARFLSPAYDDKVNSPRTLCKNFYDFYRQDNFYFLQLFSFSCKRRTLTEPTYNFFECIAFIFYSEIVKSSFIAALRNLWTVFDPRYWGYFCNNRQFFLNINYSI